MTYQDAKATIERIRNSLDGCLPVELDRDEAEMIVGMFDRLASIRGNVKIIDTDNFGGDYPNEKIVAENIENRLFAEVMAEALNNKFSGTHASRYYRIVEGGHTLQKGFEP